MSSISSTLVSPLAGLTKVINAITGKPSETSLTGNDALIKKLKEMESAYAAKIKTEMPDYKTMLPETTGASQLTYETKTPEELETAARNALLPSHQEKLDTLAESTEKKLNTLSGKIEKSEQTLAVKEDGLEEDYSADSFENADRLIKRNLVNSSIKGETEDSLYGSYLKEMQSLRAEYSILIEGYGREISAVLASKEAALLQYDLKLASELEKKVASLQAEEAKAIKEVNAYNKKIADAELYYQEKRAKSIEYLEREWQNARDKQAANEEINGYQGEKKTEMDARYELAKQFYSSIGKREATTLLKQNADNLKEVLGINYYLKLLEEIK